MFVLTELYHILADAWHTADLPARLQEWWYVVTHRHLLGEEAADA